MAYYEVGSARADVNCVFPLERLREHAVFLLVPA
jgi:hypothetical protein